MTKSHSLLSDVSTHFGFGENWRSYAATIDETRIHSAVENMQRLLSSASLKGLSFLDIGCGSGIHALAALRLGAAPLIALDIDPTSVDTCRQVLSKWHPSENWKCQVASVFELSDTSWGAFDIVYSWGVLHHTGDMWTAIRNAAALVKPGGSFAFALYKRTPLCRFWRLEKRIYLMLPRALQFLLLCLYSAADLSRLTLRGRNPVRWVNEYHHNRGMTFWHDAHDWLGGYPYESASPPEVNAFMHALGFVPVNAFGTQTSLGLTGSGCAEYLFVRGARS
jgi:2-polyprenyl-6-hydroxyphenyl methylase/3-demethylubiquinone-9 3-methyltransferase